MSFLTNRHSLDFISLLNLMKTTICSYRTPTSKLSNQNTAFIGYSDVISGIVSTIIKLIFKRFMTIIPVLGYLQILGDRI